MNSFINMLFGRQAQQAEEMCHIIVVCNVLLFALVSGLAAEPGAGRAAAMPAAGGAARGREQRGYATQVLNSVVDF